MTDTYLCKFCGEDHEVGPERRPWEWLDLSRCWCPKIPEGHCYLHDEPKGKPNGMLARFSFPALPTLQRDSNGVATRVRVLNGAADDARLAAAETQALDEIRDRRYHFEQFVDRDGYEPDRWSWYPSPYIAEAKRLADEDNKRLREEREDQA